MSEIGEKILVLRKRAGLSRDALADASGVPAAKIQAVEIGKQRIDHVALAKLASFFSVDANWLLLGDEAGDWETALGGAEPGMKRVPMRDISASAGFGLSVFDEPVRSYVQFPLPMLLQLGDPDSMELISVRGDSMAPDLRDGDQVMIDLSQAAPADDVFVICQDESLFIKRVQMTGQRRARLISANPAYPPFDVRLADPADPDDIDQDVVRLIGRVVWTGRAS